MKFYISVCCVCVFIVREGKEGNLQPGKGDRRLRNIFPSLIWSFQLSYTWSTSKFLFSNWLLHMKHNMFTLAAGPLSRHAMRGKQCQVS